MNNKKIFVFIVVIVIAVVAAFNVSIGNKKEVLSSVALENVEALANEVVVDGKTCPGGYCSKTDKWGNKCESCCPEGKDPVCDAFGCQCKVPF